FVQLDDAIGIVQVFVRISVAVRAIDELADLDRFRRLEATNAVVLFGRERHFGAAEGGGLRGRRGAGRGEGPRLREAQLHARGAVTDPVRFVDGERNVLPQG